MLDYIEYLTVLSSKYGQNQRLIYIQVTQSHFNSINL